MQQQVSIQRQGSSRSMQNKEYFPKQVSKRFFWNSCKKEKKNRIVLGVNWFNISRTDRMIAIFFSDIYFQSTYVIILLNKCYMFIWLFMAWTNWINCGKNNDIFTVSNRMMTKKKVLYQINCQMNDKIHQPKPPHRVNLIYLEICFHFFFFLLNY